MDRTVEVGLRVNGERVSRRIEARMNLVDFLREELGLTGSHVGCEHGVCGACTVRVDGRIVRGCLKLAAQADGADVWTVEGLSDTGEIRDLQEAFVERNALQCGYCTPGMLLTCAELRDRNPGQRVGRRSASSSPGITAGVRATRRSWMRSRWRAQREGGPS